jgi:hypothetical protein
MHSGPGALAPRAHPGENRVMATNIESALLRGDVSRDEGYRDIYIQQFPTFQAMHVVMSFDSPIVPTCLIRERQLLNETVRRE